MKCANACDYYADHAAELLEDQVISSDASRSLVSVSTAQVSSLQ